MTDDGNGNAASLRPPKMLIISNEVNMTLSWRSWLQQFEWYAIATNLQAKRPEVQVAIFMSVIGSDAAVIFNTFNLTVDESKDLKTIKEKFTSYFVPKVNITYERYIFNKCKQGPDETFDEFLTSLRSKTKNCSFNELEDSLICDKIVIGIKDDRIRERLLSEDNLTLVKAIDICRASEQAKRQLSSIKGSDVGELGAKQVETLKQNEKHNKTRNNGQSRRDYSKSQDNLFSCSRCGTTHGPRSCPAYGKKCKRCQHKNHFTKYCKAKKVNEITTTDEEDASTFYVSSIESSDGMDWYEKITLPQNIKVNFKLDSGSQCDVLSKNIATAAKLKINPSSTKFLLSFSKHKLRVVGEAISQVKVRNQQAEIKFMVIDQAVTPVLGKDSCVKLNLIRRIDMLDVNNDLFDGIGCLKGYEYDIDLVENPKLPIYTARKIPHALREAVKKELDFMVKHNIIVPVNEPTPAVSPMVIVRRENKLRICIDPSGINKNLKRRHYPLNTMEEIAARLHGSKWFTLLDCKKGFWQLKVTPRTSKYLTFATPFGRYSCLRMPFGLASAPEIFQQVMCSVLADTKGVEVSMDDIFIHASTREELESTTKKVLEKLKNAGLKLNPEKCIYSKQQIKFLGHLVTADGLLPDPSKVETISRVKCPTNVKELQRFLGLVTYLSKFIKNLADVTAPLRILLEKDTEWIWETQQDQAFQELKNMLKRPPVLGFYSTEKPIILSVDASSVACGGVLLQQGKPIAYCTKSLTKTEKAYSQLEKEAYAILVACKKFHHYIWGVKDLTIESDHKPLETIFKKSIAEAPPRLQRIMYQILPYNPKIIYKKGSELYIADTLSRDCEHLADERSCEDKSFQVCVIVPMSAAKIEQVRNEITMSEELSALKNIILEGWPTSVKELPDMLKKYWSFREQLAVYEDMIFKNGRVLIPDKMIETVLKTCHLSHKGIQGTLGIARDNVFWPKMKQDILKCVSKCKVCLQRQKDSPMEKIYLQEAPDRPWSQVASDLFSIHGREFIVIADAYSGYFDFVELKSITSTSVIEAMKIWFATFGIPDVLRTDNGRQYQCEQFRKFAQDWQFQHKYSSPYFPRSNGLAERYVQEAKNLLQKCMDENSDVQLALLHHRNTPRGTLGSPVQRLMSRRTKTLLPTTNKLLQPKVMKEVTKKLEEKKNREKSFADKRKRESPVFQPGEHILFRKNHQDWLPALVVSPATEPRSLIIQTPDGVRYRRNSWFIKRNPGAYDRQVEKHAEDESEALVPPRVPEEVPLVVPASVKDAVTSPKVQPTDLKIATPTRIAPESTTTRSGRRVVPPSRLDL